MIVSVGIDIVEVERIREALERNGFLERVLTPAERAVSSSPQFVAGRWAVKEAVAKAVGTTLTWQDVEILNDADGRPRAAVRPGALGPGEVLHVSVSHERGHAVGLAVLERVQQASV